MPPRQAVNILQPTQKKSDKKRIAPVLLTMSSSALSVPVASKPQAPLYAASKENHIRNILGPVVSPTVSDVQLLDARMTGALTSNASPLEDEEPLSSEAERDDGSSTPATPAVTLVPSTSAPSKRSSEPSLKRKRDGERIAAANAAAAAQAAVASKAREMAPRQPKLLNSRYRSITFKYNGRISTDPGISYLLDVQRDSHSKRRAADA